jgi:ubiquinone/menaquinone biosynthesis C-methylase UbiE
MLEWTGERFLPWIRESSIAYEHLHRYAYAATLVQNKRVLDLACGEGYGSKMLAAVASSVVGIDIDENVIRHACAKYGSTNLQFLSGSITAVPIRDDHSFDFITCFEAIEHIENQDGCLAEVQRLLKPDGVLIISTPNKAIYRDEAAGENRFHVKEFYFEEFRQFLSQHFRNLQFFGQRIHPGSSIWPISTATANGFHEFVMERGGSGFEFIDANKRIPLYFIAVATNRAAALPASASVLLDESDSLLSEKDEERVRQVTEREDTIASREKAIKWLEDQLQELKEGLEWTRNRVSDLEKTVSSQEQGLAWRARQVNELETAREFWERESASVTAQLQNTQQQLATATGTLAAIYASRGWKFIMKLRSIRDTVKGIVRSRR